MNKFTVENENLSFLKNRFKRYYKNNEVTLPDRFARREYAFVYFGGKGMFRHVTFHRKKDLYDFLSKKSPMHSYYSTAYYEDPDNPKMNNKGWMGAELIFDLDSDHLPEAEKYSYEEQLKMVKDEFIKLVEDFLINDFGFKRKYIELYFSGHRGYHCHIKDPNIFHLDGNERREIVDYIIGRDIIDNIIFKEETTSSKKYGKRKYPSTKMLKMPKPTKGGWKGRISRGIIEIVEEIVYSSNPYEKLQEYGVKKENAEKLLKDLSKERIERIKEGNLNQSKTIRKFFLNNALRKKAVSSASGETDEPVTCDIKRLIRLPGSLHGKTGLKVTELHLDQIEDFNPLDDAIVFSDDEIKVNVKQRHEIYLNGNLFRLDKGIQKIPEFLAVYLIGKKIADKKT
ncbi:MAG: DNA primase catalytic subunit PriS [Candidatus Thermoplasmatota archaeon]